MLADLLDLVLPRRCLGCEAPGALLCSHCPWTPWLEPRLVEPTPPPPGLPLTWAAAPYSDLCRESLLRFKERGARDLARPLGDRLAKVVARVPAELLLVPVPSSRAARAVRGYDHTALLCRRAVRALRRSGRTAAWAPALEQVGAVRDQAGLTSAERRANLAGSMRVARAMGGMGPRYGAAEVADRGLVVLVDDVVTTGATLVEAARALRAAGAEPAAACVLAATQRRAHGVEARTA